MKSKIYIMLAVLVALVGFTGCDDWSPADSRFPSNCGGVSLSSMAVSVDSKAASTVSRAGIDTSGFLVEILDADGNQLSYDGKPCSWTFGSMPEVMTLPVGENYTVKVRSHEPEAAAWEAPYFEGSKTFSVENGEITAIGTVTCYFMGVKVSVKFSDDLAAAMADDCNVNVRAGQGELDFGKAETRCGYYAYVEGSNTLAAHFTGTVKDQQVSRIKEGIDVEPGKYYIITFSLKAGDSTVPDEFGQVNPTGFTISTDVEEEDVNGDVPMDDPSNAGNDRPDNEEWPDPVTPDNPDNPTPDNPAANAFTVTCPTIDFEAWNPAIEGEEYVVDIVAEEPLTHMYVEIISDYLTDDFLNSAYDGLCTKFDLAYPGDLKDALSNSFHFPVGDEIVGQKHVVFNLSDFIPLLALGQLEDVPVYQHIFKLTLEDEKGNKQTVELKFDTRLS